MPAPPAPPGSPECEHLSVLADQPARLHPVAPPPPEPPPAVRAEDLFRRLENAFLRLDRLVERALPPSLNPFGQLGAIANTCLLAAVASGVLLLFWYTPSVHQAYDSLERLRGGLSGQWVRSVHRYSSGGCVLFILLHAARIAAQRRFTGPRWLPWTTGLLLLAAVWFIGWTGYWLVWDVRGQQAALGTARFLDALPVFAEPVSRSFLTDAGVPSLLFFAIFFLHMLLPLGLGIGLWLHLMRVNRARFLTGRPMTLWIVGTLAALAVLRPATSAAPARMLEPAAAFRMDGWFLWPLALTDRLGGGLLWAVFLGGGLLALAVPWWLVKRRRTSAWRAEVELARCFGCTHCALDCPFDAITMTQRTDGKPFPTQAAVDPARCVGCGICTGSCDSQAINLPALNSRVVEKRLNAWLDGELATGRRPFLALACGESAAGAGRGAVPAGWHIETVPCAGWVSAVLLERLIRRGAAGILVVGCGETDPAAREGQRWFQQRLAGRRDPAFDPRKADPARVRFLQAPRADAAGWRRAAADFQAGTPATAAATVVRWRRGLGALLVAAALAGVVWFVSDLPYRPPHGATPELVVSFAHAGAVLEARALTAEEQARRLPHMRAQANVARERAPVRLRVQVDGQTRWDESFPPRGLRRDGASITIVRLPVEAGERVVRVQLADTADPEAWTQEWTGTVRFEPQRRRVILFDTRTGFRLH